MATYHIVSVAVCATILVLVEVTAVVNEVAGPAILRVVVITACCG